MKFSSRKLLTVGLGVLALGVLLYLLRGVLHLRTFSWVKLWETIRHANPLYLLIAVIGIYGCYALRALRWQVFQRNLGKAHFGSIYGMTLAGFSAVFLLGRAGEPVRPLLLAREAKHPVADVFGIWVLERLFDLASTAVLAAVGLIVFAGRSPGGEGAGTLETATKSAGSLLAFGVFAAAIFLLYLRLHGSSMLERKLEGWRGSSGWRGTLARIVLGFVRGIQTIRTWGDFVLSTLYSAAHWALVVVIYFVVAQSFSGRLAQLSFSENMLVLVFTMVGSAVQLPAVGGGSQALTIFAYTKIFGVESEPAVAAALIVWLVTFAACSLAGVPLLIREGFSLGKLRQLAKQEKEELAEIAAGPQHDARPGDALE
ncbi:MAG TPA: lysylphosphatidylglycerol synthase transmembrane domain-containing protein [Candidatus Acidoferrum sp.]|nr:lysylphosphatidylglycerol synthase transmembrane domain-containing protein [Candidatus Acidoferrum sp.]